MKVPSETTKRSIVLKQITKNKFVKTRLLCTMQLMLNLDIEPLKKPVRYEDRILLTGSCFTEHIADRLKTHKFRVLSNPNGILFNPLSVCNSLDGYMDGRIYTQDELFHLNELWNSWDHHTRFSNTDSAETLSLINESQQAAHQFILQADWVVITLGSAFQYYLKDSGKPVSNNHRAPAQWFEKRLLKTEHIVEVLTTTLSKLKSVNPYCRVIFTISPVRHIRDGVVENNRSKARLIDAVHRVCEQTEDAYYFPAYELIIDVLRDYRFYDIDLVHPNFLATNMVWERFMDSCIDPAIHGLIKEIHEIVTARNHRTRFPDTKAHHDFMNRYADKVRTLIQKHPFLDLSEELSYFGKEKEMRRV